jgi:AraC-like DNA-binding protein
VSGSTPPSFAEEPIWRAVGDGWRPLFGNFRNLGFSFEWHNFKLKKSFDWARSFHPCSLELCLNLSGRAEIHDGRSTIELREQTLDFYYQGEPPLSAVRHAGELHQFITVEFAPEFLRQHLGAGEAGLHPVVQAIIRGRARKSAAAPCERLDTSLQALVESLRHPPVFAPAQAIWFQTKAIELAARLFFRPPDGELFCTRAQRSARDRVEKVRALLRERINNPPTLDELGRIVGCSPFYLSRLFSQESGATIQQFIRQIRMERAAELLRAGKCNVTEAAQEVGYNSLSNFSASFHETFCCCPWIYPIQTETQKGQS